MDRESRGAARNKTCNPTIIRFTEVTKLLRREHGCIERGCLRMDDFHVVARVNGAYFIAMTFNIPFIPPDIYMPIYIYIYIYLPIYMNYT